MNSSKTLAEFKRRIRQEELQAGQKNLHGRQFVNWLIQGGGKRKHATTYKQRKRRKLGGGMLSAAKKKFSQIMSSSSKNEQKQIDPQIDEQWDEKQTILKEIFEKKLNHKVIGELKSLSSYYNT